jgi:hypothetical protein
MFGYTEPFRRFVQHETFSPQSNEIPNTAASWLPGDDYYTNFHEGDPFIKVDEGYARLPGEGYAALHPEVKDLDPEDYPDIHKMAILANVAPYSCEYNTYRQHVGKQAENNTELELEYEKILNRVKQTRESVIRMQDRHFTVPKDLVGFRPGENVLSLFLPPLKAATDDADYSSLRSCIWITCSQTALAIHNSCPGAGAVSFTDLEAAWSRQR